MSAWAAYQEGEGHWPYSSENLQKASLVQAPGAPRDQSQHPRARNDYDEETAYESYMNPEPGFQSGPGDSSNAD